MKIPYANKPEGRNGRERTVSGSVMKLGSVRRFASLGTLGVLSQEVSSILRVATIST